jgi:5-methylcytosine-specific restriction endonuclease McrA
MAEELDVLSCKKCTKCGETKSVDLFYFTKKGSNKKRAECKKCIIGPPHPKIKNSVKWIDRPGNRDRINATRRAHYNKHADHFREIAKKRRAENIEEILRKSRAAYASDPKRHAAMALKSHKKHYATARAWKKANPDKVAEYSRRYSLKNPGHHIPARHLRRARKKSVKCERIKKGLIERLLLQQRGLCPYCSIELVSTKKHLDHIIPLARGGSHTELNFQITCQPCNQRKYTKHPLDFAAEMGIVINPTLIAI